MGKNESSYLNELIDKKLNYNVKSLQKIANSWGQDWGQTGYFKIRRGINECLIESFVIGAWAQTDKHLKQLRQFRMRQRMGRSKRNFRNRNNHHRRRHYKKPWNSSLPSINARHLNNLICMKKRQSKLILPCLIFK